MDIRQAAKTVVGKTHGDVREVFIDPITIMLICSILGAIFQGLRLYCQWKQGQEEYGVIEVCKSPTVASKRMVRNAVARHAGRRLTGHHQRLLADAIFEAGANASPHEIRQLIQQREQGEFGEWEV